MESVEFRDAADLYANLSVDHVCLVLESTSASASQKKQELRELISLRYHDLIDSADAIVGMDRTVDEFKGLVNKLEKEASNLVNKDSAALYHEIARKEEPRLAPHKLSDEIGVDMAAQVAQADVLSQAAVDIWERIDSQELWTACELFAKAQAAHEYLEQFKCDSPASVDSSGPQVDVEALALLGLEQDEINVNKISQQNVFSGPLCSDPVNIWQAYPYLQSHWSLVGQAKSKILQEAKLLLASEEMSLEATCGSIRAMIALGDVTAEESIQRLLQSRSEMLSVKLAQGTLPAVLAIALQTVVDVADIYILDAEKLGEKAKVDSAYVMQQMTRWLKEQTLIIEGPASRVLDAVTCIEDLLDAAKNLADLESTGGLSSSDTFLDLEEGAWDRACASCVDPTQLGVSADKLSLFFLFFRAPVLTRAGQLLGQLFERACTSTAAKLELALAASKKTSAGNEIDGSGQDESQDESQDSDDNEEGEEDHQGEHGGEDANTRYSNEQAALCGALISSENAIDRGKAAVKLVKDFLQDVLNIANLTAQIDASERLVSPACSQQQQQQQTHSFMDHQVGKRYDSEFGKMVDRMAQALEQSQEKLVVAAQNAAQDHSLTTMQGATSELKGTLFVARVAQALISGIKPVLSKVLSADSLTTCSETLQNISTGAHRCFSDLSVALSKPILLFSLERQTWEYQQNWSKLYSGWERIPLDFDDSLLGGAEEDDGDENLQEQDGEALPGTVSPGVASFSFQLSKQVRVIGDSGFISSKAVLRSALGSTAGDAQPEWVELFLQRCANEFCSASQQAILELSTKGLSFVRDAYDEYIKRAMAEHAQASQGADLSTPDAPVLQILFDLYWFEWLLFIQDKPEKASELKAIIDFLLDPVNDFIDPINWELCGDVLASRVKAYRERNALLFGPILVVKAHFQNFRSTHNKGGLGGFIGTVDTSSAYDTNNTLYLGYLGHKTLARIPLLPIPSTMRSLQGKRSTRDVKRQVSHRSLLAGKQRMIQDKMDPSAGLAGSAEEAASALKSMGTNLFSQANSWFNR